VGQVYAGKGVESVQPRRQRASERIATQIQLLEVPKVGQFWGYGTLEAYIREGQSKYSLGVRVTGDPHP
jgi:hypothetical protein